MDMEPFENEGNFQEDVGMFEAAAHARPVQLSKPPIERIHLALDGSNQDAAARELARAFAAATGASVTEQSSAENAAAILEPVEHERSSLLVLPVPFGRDYEVLADESLGSIVDMLLLDSPCPVLCVRDVLDAEQVQEAFADVLVPIAVCDEHVTRACSWAFRAAAKGGRVELFSVVDRDVLEEARRLLPDSEEQTRFQPAQIERETLKELGGLVSASQQLGQAEGINVHVECRIGRFVELVSPRANDGPRLTVWGTERDHNSSAFHRGVDLILAAKGPVLIV